MSARLPMTDRDAELVRLPDVRIGAEAAARLRRVVSGTGVDGVRLTVLAEGISGRLFDLQLIDAPEEADQRLDIEGIRVYVPLRDVNDLGEVCIEFVDGAHGAGFHVVDAGGDDPCGCAG